MSTEPAPHPPAVPPRFRWRRRAAWAIGALVVLVVVLFVSAGSGLWWTLRSDAGTAWLLSRLPGLVITGGKGTLWGDYEAERIEFALPGGGKLVMSGGAGWHGLRVEHAPWLPYQARVLTNGYTNRYLPLAGRTSSLDSCEYSDGLVIARNE